MRFISYIFANLLGRPARYRDRLLPGEYFGPLYLNVGLGRNPQPGTDLWTPAWTNPQTGMATLFHAATIHVSAPGVSGRVTEPGWRPAELRTGELKLAVASTE